VFNSLNTPLKHCKEYFVSLDL